VIGGFYIGECYCILHALGNKKDNLAEFNLADFCNSPNRQNKFYAKFLSYTVVIFPINILCHNIVQKCIYILEFSIIFIAEDINLLNNTDAGSNSKAAEVNSLYIITAYIIPPILLMIICWCCGYLIYWYYYR